ncbi:acyloxyacyl hydrolase [Rhizobium sp. Leaf321]|uniref:acyloxyacyl hydrolase n=1 Tax=Rhizobium sp. Leaf321 TaxID=1736335 RepID=UPI000A895AAD|nr:acyloxyacyl hydrolase [Rhizobium sp. Leaf321]
MPPISLTLPARIALAAPLAFLSMVATPIVAAEQLFDDARFGVLTSLDSGRKENGVFLTGMLLTDPFGREQATGVEKVLRPRLHVGGELSTTGETSQVYAGFSWTVPVTRNVFVEAGFGGALHDGNLDSGDDPQLGCRALFHEYVAAGVKLLGNWQLLAQAGHSSHANLCDGPNDGLTRAGLTVGYRF